MCFENKPDHERSLASPSETCRNTDVQFSSREPSLDEILADPLIRLLMARDKVEASTLRYFARKIARRATASEVAS